MILAAEERLILSMSCFIQSDTSLTFTVFKEATSHPKPHKITKQNHNLGAYIIPDTCLLINPKPTQRKNHIRILICKASLYAIANFLKNEKGILQLFYHILHHIRQKMKHPLSDLRTNNTKENTSNRIWQTYAQHQTTHPLRNSKLPQEISIAKLINRAVIELFRAVFTAAKLPHHFFEDLAGVNVLNYNHIYCSGINTPRYRIWYGTKTNIYPLSIFGETGAMPIY